MTNLLPRVEFLAQSLVRRRRDCPYCGEPRAELLARKRLLVRVRRCRRCLLCFTDPIYERSVFGSLYDGLYRAEGSTTRTPDPERLARELESAFRGTDKDFHDRLERIAELSAGPRLLEVGSSWGYFLHQARGHGFRPTGVEISTDRREFGRRELGLRIVSGLDELAEERFDVVYTAHSLEHFTAPARILERLRDRLAPGGLLAVEVPHFDFETRGKEALSVVGAVHPLGFTTAFFARNLPLVGLSVLGFYDRWEDVPGRPVERCTEDVVVVLATLPDAAAPDRSGGGGGA